jgi:hypothetical protein
MKVVINKCYGGFSISPEAALWLYERGFKAEGFVTPIENYWSDLTAERGKTLGYKAQLARWQEYRSGKHAGSSFITVFAPDEKSVLSTRPDCRHDPLLIECIETLGDKANGRCAELKIIEIPDGVDYTIDEYDGMEHIAEKHRTWG